MCCPSSLLNKGLFVEDVGVGLCGAAAAAEEEEDPLVVLAPLLLRTGGGLAICFKKRFTLVRINKYLLPWKSNDILGRPKRAAGCQSQLSASHPKLPYN